MRIRSSLRLAQVALLATTVFGFAGTVSGQQDEDDAIAESETAEFGDEEAGSGIVDDESGTADTEGVDEELTDVESVDDAVVEDDTGTLAVEEDWQPVPLTDDEQWAPAVTTDPADYSIPIDTELNPTGEDWDVVDAVEVGHETAMPTESPGDLRDPDDMPIVRRPQRRAPATRPRNDDDTPYSMGGQPVRADGAPWQAQIYYPGNAPQWSEKLKQGMPLWQLQHVCGGTLIADDWVLTAAHCIDEEMVQAGYKVRLGARDISKDDGMSYRIERIVRHSQYDDKLLPASPNMYANDIALIRIVADGKAKPRDPTRIRPIPLYEKPLAPGAEVAATGWGKTEPVEQHAPSAVLMRVVLQVMDTERCKTLPGYGPQKIHGKVICAADQKKSTCRGDSGGALTLARGAPSVVGVISWGKKRCSGDGNPGAYTRVESYLGWIKQAMQLDPAKNSLP